jgi:SDR family mycofactocin-dependent oxidoreductase
MGSLDGKVAFISGVARGQGRSHALRLAALGADIVGVDICHDIPSMNYPNASAGDLARTVRDVEATGRRMVAVEADIRDAAAVRAAVDQGWAELGRLDIVLSNAGIVRLGSDTENPDDIWQDTIGVNLSGGFHVVWATVPKLIEGGRGGVIILTGSTAGTRPIGGYSASTLSYTASKWGLAGLCKQLAEALAQHSIRVNIIHPTGVASGMTMNPAMAQLQAAAAAAGQNAISAMRNALPVDILQPGDISDAVEFLVSDKARWITGVSLPVDAGFSVR